MPLDSSHDRFAGSGVQNAPATAAHNLAQAALLVVLEDGKTPCLSEDPRLRLP